MTGSLLIASDILGIGGHLVLGTHAHLDRRSPGSVSVAAFGALGVFAQMLGWVRWSITVPTLSLGVLFVRGSRPTAGQPDRGGDASAALSRASSTLQ